MTKPMTVAEMIAALSALPPDEPVFAPRNVDTYEMYRCASDGNLYSSPRCGQKAEHVRVDEVAVTYERLVAVSPEPDRALGAHEAALDPDRGQSASSALVSPEPEGDKR